VSAIEAGSRVCIHAVVRNRVSERALDAVQGMRDGVEYRLVDHGGLAAVVTDGDGAADTTDALRSHGRIVSRLLRRSSVVPVPAGFVARDDQAVRAFLEGQRVPLLEALEYLEDSYEVRLHLSVEAAGHSDDQLRSVAHHVYEQLQQQSRAARILSEGAGERLLSAAFLIPRGEWIGFVERVADWEGRYPSVRMDVTGPWAAWDFVHIMPAAAPPTHSEET
jgi:hypothetical protein